MSTNSSFKSVRATAASAKKGNVLALLNTLYASGLGAVSPTSPMLTGRTMHTLYAVSFLVYFADSLVDWAHVFFILRGHAVSFPLQPAFSISLVVLAVVGSMLNGLLMALCMENAFVSRLNLAPYRNGFAVVAEAAAEWLQNFNNFRVAFLVMLLRDLPWTVINYFLLTSCRWPKLAWSGSIIVSTTMTIVSLMWRGIMLYFSYRRLIFGDKVRRKSSRPVKPVPGVVEQVKLAISTSEGGRLDEFDEAWPIRYAISRVYGINYQRMTTKIFLTEERRKFSERVAEFCSIIIFRSVSCVKFSLKRTLCVIIAGAIYVGWMLVCCLPCCWFYLCRNDSLVHRHKCSRSFVRLCTLVYHYTVFALSALLTIVLLAMNFVLLSSVHVHQWNQVPPSLNYICLQFDSSRSIVQPSLSSTDTPTPFDQFSSEAVCKDIWSQSAHDKYAVMMKPWQVRYYLTVDTMLVVSVFVHGNITNPQEPFYGLYYDYGIMKVEGNKLRCVAPTETKKWRFDESLHLPSFPYFFCCLPSISIFRYTGISC